MLSHDQATDSVSYSPLISSLRDPFVAYSGEPKKHPPDVTLKSQCYFDFLGSFEAHSEEHAPTRSKELWIPPHALELVRQNPILLISTTNTPKSMACRSINSA
jgi:hypothetical protein